MVHELGARLLRSIRKNGLLKPGDRIAAAVSGGADSVALLLMLLELRNELGIVLSVAHVNHKLRREESDADQRFVEELCSKHGLELHCWTASVNARESGIEAAARELRYSYFRQLAAADPGMKIATGHTLDDQAETVLLRILRGTGIRGLAGIHPRLVLHEQTRVAGEVVRPLLSFRHDELLDFLRERGQAWREDSTNQDPRFLRNRIRREVLTVLREKFGPVVVENLANLAEIARAEEEHWNLCHSEIYSHAAAVSISSLLSLPLALQRRVVRAWIESQTQLSPSFRIVEEVLELVHSLPGSSFEVASGHQIRRTRESLCFETRAAAELEGYEYSLPVPGAVVIPELAINLRADLVDVVGVPEWELDRLLDPGRLPPVLTVRNWRPGDRFWPVFTKEPRKVKELLSDRHITGVDRKLWPVAVAGATLVWMRDFPAHEDFFPKAPPQSAIWIRETKLRL